MPSEARKANLTKASIAGLNARQTRYYVNDTKQVGLCVKVEPNGSKFFVAYRKVDGKPYRKTIGRCEQITVDLARTQVIKMAGEIANGDNPFLKRKAKSGELLFGQLYDAYMIERSKPFKRSWKDDQGLYDRYLKAHWEKKPVDEIDQIEIQARHKAVSEKPTKRNPEGSPGAANRMVTLVSSIFVFANETNRWSNGNPTEFVVRNAEQQKSRFLHFDEMPAFKAALDAEPNRTIATYLLLSLQIGARQGNMLAMRWDELNFKRQQWLIPKTKNGRELLLHLPDEAIEVLKVQKKIAGDSEWVFPSNRSAVGHIVEPKATWAKVVDRAGLKGLKIHQLRHTFVTWQLAMGVPIKKVSESAGHKSVQSTERYAHLNVDFIRDGVNKVNALMAKLAAPAGEHSSEAYEDFETFTTTC